MAENNAGLNDIETLYLHGFLSCGQSQKGRWLESANSDLSERPLGSMHFPTYAQKNLLEGLKPIERMLQYWHSEERRVLLMGSSLGGYLAQYFAHRYQTPYIMINPALNPLSLFADYTGEHINPYTGEKVTVDQAFCQNLAELEVGVLNRQIPSLMLVDRDDEVVDIEFAVQRYQDLLNAKTVVYPGGDHAFQHMPEAWPEIQRFIQRAF